MAETVAMRLALEHEVPVLCGRPSYDSSEGRSWKLWQTEHQGNVEVVGVGSTDFPRWQMIKRLLNYLTYVALAVPRALLTPGDVILAMTDPPFEGIIGAVVAMLKGKPFVYNIRDLYPDMAVGGGIFRGDLLVWVCVVVHRWALRSATCVIVLGRDVRTRITAQGLLAKTIQTLPAATHFPLRPPPAPNPNV